MYYYELLYIFLWLVDIWMHRPDQIYLPKYLFCPTVSRTIIG